MAYDLMLLADPGPERAHVLRVLRAVPDLRPDPRLENRFWLTTPAGEAQLNIGTKDPVESIHVEFVPGSLPLLDAVVERTLSLAAQLSMYVEDVQWGHEVTAESFPRLRAHWECTLPAGPRPLPPAPGRPWWRFW